MPGEAAEAQRFLADCGAEHEKSLMVGERWLMATKRERLAVLLAMASLQGVCPAAAVGGSLANLSSPQLRRVQRKGSFALSAPQAPARGFQPGTSDLEPRTRKASAPRET